MEIVAIVLAVFGLIVLLIGWRKEDPINEDLTTALKGIAYLKKEVERLEEEKIAPLQSALTDLTGRMDKQEQLVSRPAETAGASAPAWIKEARDVVEALIKIGKDGGKEANKKKEREKGKEKSRDSDKDKEKNKDRDKERDKERDRDKEVDKEREEAEDDGQPAKQTAEPPVSNIYSSVLELSGQGLDVREISARLGISQDAVDMVLRTAAGGDKV